MAISDRIPTDYESALRALKSKNVRSLGCNTVVAREYGAVALVLYGTIVARFYADDSIALYTGGYPTKLTQSRMNDALGGSGWGVGSIRGEWQWFHWGRHVCEFEDSDRVYLAPRDGNRFGIYEDYPHTLDRCGHSSCRQNFCDTGELWCVASVDEKLAAYEEKESC